MTDYHVLRLVCDTHRETDSQDTEFGEFLGSTLAACEYKARQAGWVMTGRGNKSCQCPDCAKENR
jgi:hypothetical protein